MVQEWATGNRVVKSDDSVLSYLHEPPARKPLNCSILTQQEAEEGVLQSPISQITLIHAGSIDMLHSGHLDFLGNVLY